MKELPDLSVEKYQDNTEVVHLTAKQIAKDFAMFGIEITFSGHTSGAYHELMVQLGDAVKLLLQNNSGTLFSLFYQIDLKPGMVDECLRHSPDPHLCLADLVIRREMLKVLTARYFKQLKNKS